jgi:II/X family phage/plasmid replication protein
MIYFFDWVKVYQDFDFQLPIVSNRAYANIDVQTGDILTLSQPTFQHKGSFSSVVSIRITGNRITIDANPSRYNRLDNLFGLTSLDACMDVYNKILVSLGLPEFTKCTKVFQTTDKVKGSAKFDTSTDGAVFQRIDVTSNMATSGCSLDYIKGISTLTYRNSNPNLYPNGTACDWRTASGGVSSLMYAKLYDKAHEIKIHALKKIKNSLGVNSTEYAYLLKLYDYCMALGVVRFEQEFKSELLRRMHSRFWGLFDDSVFEAEHLKFRALDERLQVTSMDYETVGELLIRNGHVTSTKSANTTSLYFLQWMHGQKFDKSKSQVQVHRARLRKIGIDICRPCNVSSISPIQVKSATEVLTSNIEVPSWYRVA